MRVMLVITLVAVAFVAGLVLCFAAPVFFVAFLFDILYYDADFWSSAWTAVWQSCLVELAAYCVIGICTLWIYDLR